MGIPLTSIKQASHTAHITFLDENTTLLFRLCEVTFIILLKEQKPEPAHLCWSKTLTDIESIVEKCYIYSYIRSVHRLAH